MKHKRSTRIIALILSVCLFVTMMPATAFATAPAEQIPVGEVEVMENPEVKVQPKDVSEVTEEDVLMEKSSESVTTFDLGGGYEAKVLYSYDVRYQDEDGELIEFDPELVEISKASTETEQGVSLEGYKYVNRQGKYKHYIPEDISEATPLLMERSDKYAITMAPTGNLRTILNKSKVKGNLKKDLVQTAANRTVNKNVIATYGEAADGAYIEYTSLNDSVKEEIVLTEVPKKNEFTFKLTLKGLTYKMNATDNGITFYDPETKEIIAAIEAPFMNDATGEAYSEAIYYSLERRGNSDNYTLTMTVDEDYLNDEDRVYPVTIDPTVYWVGSSQIRDAYIISGYPTTNFYSSDVRIMVSGTGTDGKHRTPMKLVNLKSELLGYDITSAYFDIYETGTGLSDIVVRVYKILESWDEDTVTWNTCPDWGTATSYLDYDTSTGTTFNRLRFYLTDWVQSVADGGSNYGLMLKNQVEASTSYTEFYGSRHTQTAYRPKLTVVYTEPVVEDIPSAPTSVTVTDDVITGTESAEVNWSGITADSLASVQYKVVPCDEDWYMVGESSIAWGTLVSGSQYSLGTETIPGSASLTDGNYAVLIRGVSSTGDIGDYESAAFVVDRTLPNVSLSAGNGSSYSYVYWNTTDTDFDSIYFYVDGDFYASSTNTSGYQFFLYDDFIEGLSYDITVIYYDVNGNYDGNAYNFYVPYTDYYAPEIGSVTLSMDGTTLSESNWYNKSSGTFTLSYSGITDDSGVATIKYSVYKGDRTGTEVAAGTSSTTSASGNFSIPMGSGFAEDGKYIFVVTATDNYNHSAEMEVVFQKDTTAPTGDITVKNELLTKKVSELRGIVNFDINPADTGGSGIKSANLILKSLSTDESYPIISNATGDANIFVDTADYADGFYSLILTVTDNVDLVTTKTVNMTVDNRLIAPNLNTSVTGTANAAVSWSFPHAMDKLVSMQYSVDNGTSWTTAAIGDSQRSGTIAVTLPSSATGDYTVLVRGLDNEGVAGIESSTVCSIDATGPAVSITSLVNGILTGSIEDTHLDSWEVFVKVKDSDDSTYTSLFTGTDSVENGRIGIVDLSADSYVTDTMYTVKVSAEDIFGNTGFATYDVLKDATYQSAYSVNAVFRITRGPNQTYDSNTFLIGTEAAALNLNTVPTGTVKWFVNNVLVSSDATYTADLDALYVEDTSYPITVIEIGNDGSREYSSDLVENAENYTVDWTAAIGTATEKEVVITFAEPVTSFIVSGASESSDGNAVSYQVKIGDGEYQTVIADSKIYVNDVLPSTLTATSITVKAIVTAESEWTTLTSANVSVDVLDQEYFEISSVENYVPKNLSAEEGLNYKTYIKWQTDSSQALPDNVYYEVHRGTTTGFVPGVDTLAANDVKAQYWSELNVNYSDTYYYKVRAVKKDSAGTVIASSTFSNEMAGTVVSYDEYTKRLGQKNYWAYGELDIPEANVNVEKSTGNMVYTQVDGTITNQKLAIELVRAYNSQATSKGSFGYGWTHSYDMELLSLTESDILSEGSIILKDGNGTLFWFDKTEDGKYNSSLRSYVTLEKVDKSETVILPVNDGTTRTVEVNSAYTLTTKDKVECRFNSGGQLIYLADASGNIVLVEYDTFYGVPTKITTGQNASITFNYDTAATGDPLLVSEVVLADGQKLQYTYSGNKLVKVTEVGDETDALDDIIFEYGYEPYNKMYQLKDGNGNLYEITYDDYNRVTLVEYPSTNDEHAAVHTEAVQFVYTANDNTNSSTVTNKLVDDGIVATETDYFDPAYGSRTKHIDAEGYITEYAFKDNMPAETRYEVEYTEILDGIVEKKTTYKVDKNQYNENDDIETQQDNEDTVTYYTYSTEAGKSDLVTSMVEKTAAGVTIANETYQYDEKRNVIVEKDLINNTVTRTTYNYTGAGKGEIATQKEYVLNGTSEILQTSTTNTYSYNSQGELVVTRVETSDGTTVTTVTTYDAAGKIKTEEYTYVNSDGSKNQKVLTNVYDGHGRIARQVTTESDLSSAGEVDSATTIEFITQIEYDGNGNVTRKEENDGTIYTYQFDDSNNLIRETVQKDGASKYLMSEYAYEDVTIHTGIGTNATKIYPKAYVVTESLVEDESAIVISKKYYDTIGRVVREISGTVQTDYCYDAQGQITSIYKIGLTKNDNGTITEDVNTENHEILLYDSNGNQTTHVQRPVWNAETGKFAVGADSIVTTNVYDSRGNLLSMTDGLGYVTQYTYNANDEITSVTLPDGTKTTYTYDVFDTAGNKLKDVTTYANGAVTETKYNATGKVLSITDKGDVTIVKTYEYDSQDNMTKELYSKGNYKTYEYDARDRVVAINYYDSTGDTETERTEYTYNTADLVTTMIDYNVSETTKTPYRYTGYFYDSFNRLSGKAELNVTDMPSEATIEAAKITYEYDINDNVIKANYPAVGSMAAHSLVYEYDSTKQRLMKVSRVSGDETTVLRTYTYRSDGKTETITSNGITETYQYDEFDRMTSKTYTDGSTVKENHTYTYDKNHNIVSEVIVNNWATTAVNETRTYTYDAIGQLISSTITPAGSSTGITTTYTYDSVGNRKTETVDGTSTTEYTHNNLNQLKLEKIVNSGTLSAEIEYYYDANGNLIAANDSGSGPDKAYAYDASNQMISYSEGTTLVQTNLYNGNGQRIRRTEGTDVTNFFYEEDALLYMTDGNNALKAFQLYDGYGELFATARTASSGDVLYYYTDDARGSITNLVDENKAGVVSYTYTDFGETTESNGGSFYNEIRFTGGVYDETTGLYYLNARFYDPANGRFLNPDSYRGEPADPQSLHLYAYCANNPINNVDPTGNIIESALDAASLVDSVVNFAVNPTLGNLAYVAADTVALAVPGVPSTGTAKAIVKATSKISKTKVAAKASKAVGKVVSKGKSASKIQSAKVTKKVTNKATNSTKLKKVTAQKNQRKVKASTGRSGKQARLKALLNDDKLSSALKGEIKRDLNEIKRGKRKNIRVPSGYELAHKRGYEARKGYGYEYSNLNTKKDHRRQHKFDNNGRKR